MKFEGYLGPLGIVRTDVNQQEWIHIPQEIGGETIKTNCILMGLKSVAQWNCHSSFALKLNACPKDWTGYNTQLGPNLCQILAHANTGCHVGGRNAGLPNEG